MASQQHLRPPHPRRPPAQRSVSLLHNTRPASKNSRSTHADTSDSSPSSTRPLVSKDSSGESSNADKWFERSNNNATGNSSTVIDNDPPFFLQHSSSEETPIDGANGATSMYVGGQAIPMHMTLGTDDSGSSDFRAVIDDLTVENKKLKRRLKKYEKLHDAHLNDEKLFEVRVHGLSSAKRRELEDMLRKFAVGATGQPPATGSTSSNLYERVIPTLKTHQTASSSSNFADSAYASNSASASASGQASSGAVSNSNSSNQSRPQFKRSARSRHNNIQTYLHDIPEGLLPQHPAVMTEKTKKKLVVRRLEQIFAGTGAAKGDHHHPIQQQEVSQLAAKADRSALEATGQLPSIEGCREAPIMHDEGEERSNKNESPEDKMEMEPAQGIEPSQKVAGHDFAASPEQRPTRPLDLDPHRAQNPIENIQYIRHLGFSPPDYQAREAPEEGHGWIYLNFLCNMAQLHTLNVTSDFAKKALMDYSSKFELSRDGRKVRWKGGSTLTRTSSEHGDDSPYKSVRSPDSKSPRKRTKSSHHSSSGQKQHSKKRMLERQDNRFTYTPLFFHRSSDEDSDTLSSSEDEESESQFLAPPGGDSSGMTSSGVRTVSAKKSKKRENGPIIFYSNAKFCTDLSGDPKTEVAMAYNPILYHVATNQAVGVPGVAEADSRGALECRGPLDAANDLPEAMNLDDNPIPEALEVRFPSQTPISQLSGSSGLARSPMELQASGIGGTCPSDNFSINVRTKLRRTEKTKSLSGQRKQYPTHIADILNGSGRNRGFIPVLEEDVLQTNRQQLPPSELPPASCFMDIDECDDDSDAESLHSIYPDMDGGHDVPSAAPQAMDVAYMSSGSEGEEESEGEEDDGQQSEGSVDLLATARKLDPETVRAREREYDAHMAERWAEEIPAGSSAATAGGGSGFASPASGIDKNEYENARVEYLSRQASAGASVPSFQRAQTSDSMVVNGKSP